MPNKIEPKLKALLSTDFYISIRCLYTSPTLFKKKLQELCNLSLFHFLKFLFFISLKDVFNMLIEEVIKHKNKKIN